MFRVLIEVLSDVVQLELRYPPRLVQSKPFSSLVLSSERPQMFKEQCCLIILSFLNIIVTVVGLKQSRKKVQKLNYEKVFASLEVSLGKNIGKQLVKTNSQFDKDPCSMH